MQVRGDASLAVLYCSLKTLQYNTYHNLTEVTRKCHVSERFLLSWLANNLESNSVSERYFCVAVLCSIHLVTRKVLHEITLNFTRLNVYYFFFYGSTALGGLGLVIVRRFTITLIDTPRSVGLLWTRDQLVAETST
jgi:hypothetical protein